MSKKRRSKGSGKSSAPPPDAPPSASNRAARRNSKRPSAPPVEASAPKPADAIAAATPSPKQATKPAVSGLRDDEISVPPTTSDLDDAFFESQSPPAHARVPAELEVTADLRHEQLTSPAAHARRAHLAKYVKAAVGVSLAVCFVAFVRLAVQRNHSGVSETTAMAATEPPRATVPSPASKPMPVPAAKPEPAEPVKTAEPAKAPEPSPEMAQPQPQPQAAPPEPAPAPAPPAETATAEASADVAADPAAAKKMKHESQIALERGKVAESIEKGELAAKLDPEDGETWLILGAAYQSKGDWTNARRCFKSCLSEGKRGPRGECSAMLR